MNAFKSKILYFWISNSLHCNVPSGREHVCQVNSAVFVLLSSAYVQEMSDSNNKVIYTDTDTHITRCEHKVCRKVKVSFACFAACIVALKNSQIHLIIIHLSLIKLRIGIKRLDRSFESFKSQRFIGLILISSAGWYLLEHFTELY